MRGRAVPWALVAVLAASCNAVLGLDPVTRGAGGGNPGGRGGVGGNGASPGSGRDGAGEGGEVSTGGSLGGGATGGASSAGRNAAGTTSAGGSGGKGGGAGADATGGAAGAGGNGGDAGGPAGTGGKGAGGASAGDAGSAGMSAGGSSAGDAGSAGMPSGGSAGSAGMPNLLAVASNLDGKMLTAPCGSPTAPDTCTTNSGGCPAANTGDPALSGRLMTDLNVTLGGDPGLTYSITLRVQGVVESKRYTSTVDAESSSTTPMMNGFATAGTPFGGDSYAVYMIRVSDPPQDYFLNSLNPPGVSNHTTYGVDYTATITAKGEATLRLVAADSNCSLIMNCGPVANTTACMSPIIIDADQPARMKNPSFDFDTAYNGQWLVLMVTDVTTP